MSSSRGKSPINRLIRHQVTVCSDPGATGRGVTHLQAQCSLGPAVPLQGSHPQKHGELAVGVGGFIGSHGARSAEQGSGETPSEGETPQLIRGAASNPVSSAPSSLSQAGQLAPPWASLTCVGPSPVSTEPPPLLHFNKSDTSQ